jgi:hypothetical protein
VGNGLIHDDIQDNSVAGEHLNDGINFVLLRFVGMSTRGRGFHVIYFNIYRWRRFRVDGCERRSDQGQHDKQLKKPETTG